MIALALALALIAPQDGWPFFGDKANGEMGLALDPATIKRDGDIRTATGHMTLGGEETRYILVDLRIDCAASKAFIMRGVGYQNGAPVEGQVTAPPGGVEFTTDAIGGEVIGYLCKR